MVGKILFSPDADTYHENLSKSDTMTVVLTKISYFHYCRGRVPLMKRESVTSGSDSDSPAILRKKENYTWTPKGVTLNAVRQNYCYDNLQFKFYFRLEHISLIYLPTRSPYAIHLEIDFGKSKRFGSFQHMT